MNSGDEEFAHLAFGGVENCSFGPDPEIAFWDEASDLGP